MNSNSVDLQSRKLLKYGVILFLLGLITGFIIPMMQNPRMGLSSHLEGVLNGMFLILIGLVWPKLLLPKKVFRWSYLLLIYGTFINWGTTLFAALLGAGTEMMPLAGSGMQGTLWQEIIIKFGLVTLSIAMLAACGIIIYGLRGRGKQD